MNFTIKNPSTTTLTKIPNKESLPLQNKKEYNIEHTYSTKDTTVSISNAGQALYIQNSATARQATMTKGELNQLYANTWSDVYNFSLMLASKNYNKDDYLPKTNEPARLELGQRSLEYAISLHQSPQGDTPNPFTGMARNNLSAVVYDDSGTYTMAERYAASVELRRQDEAYFSKLITKITNGGNNREFFKGIWDYFDDLPPVEKSPYPDSYRASIDSLYQEQLDLWGPFDQVKQSTKESGERSSESLFKLGQSPQEMLQAVLEKALESIKS
jgi:hypothetical protein